MPFWHIPIPGNPSVLTVAVEGGRSYAAAEEAAETSGFDRTEEEGKLSSFDQTADD